MLCALQVDLYGRTPLLEAARLNHLELVRLLLELQVDASKADHFGRRGCQDVHVYSNRTGSGFII